jgi:hypothetical protein
MSLTLSQRRAWARRGDREIQRTIDAAKSELAAQREAERAAVKAAFAERNKPIPYTTEELKAATHIRTVVGWHKVVRVSAKSVTVETGYSWTDRYTLDKIIQVATIAESKQ